MAKRYISGQNGQYSDEPVALTLPVFEVTALLCVAVLILTFSLKTALADDYILFFSATTDRALYDREPTKYHWVIPDVGRKHIYVERLPITKISTTEVESVMIQKEEILEDPAKPTHESNKSNMPDDAYVATFILNREGSYKLKALTRNHAGEWIGIALDDQLLTPTIILEPIEGEQFTIGLMKRSKDEVKKLFVPLEIADGK